MAVTLGIGSLEIDEDWTDALDLLKGVRAAIADRHHQDQQIRMIFRDLRQELNEVIEGQATLLRHFQVYLVSLDTITSKAPVVRNTGRKRTSRRNKGVEAWVSGSE